MQQLAYRSAAIKLADVASNRTTSLSPLQTCETLLDHISQGVCMFSADERVIVCNRQYAALYGLTMDEVSPGVTLAEIVALRRARGQYVGASAEDDRQGRSNPRALPAESIEVLSDGRSIAVRRCPMEGGGWVTTHEDITARCRNEERISHLATHDPLTNIANRHRFTRQLDDTLARVRNGESLALHWIDLDHFKAVNDSAGHAIGDEILKQVASRLKSTIRSTDLVARMGGDEFAILQTPAPNAAASEVLASRLVDVIDRPFWVGGRRFMVGASIGVATVADEAVSAASLMLKADLALYQAKRDGRHIYRFFDESLEQDARRRSQTKSDLARAIVQGELAVHYQPIVDLTTRRVGAFEALVRWNHPKRGSISPLDFIPTAEETGLIVPIGELVLRTACQDAMNWPAGQAVAVNLSAAQFVDGGPTDTIARVLAETGLSPSRLQLEITESVVIHDVGATLAIIHDLKKLGVQISMDDFGTGYSSLSCLSRIPFDKLKIDRSFVKGLPVDKGALAVLRTIARLGKSLGMHTVAEGVETAAQLQVAVEEGFGSVQGYFFSPPRPVSQILAQLDAIDAKARSTLQTISEEAFHARSNIVVD